MENITDYIKLYKLQDKVLDIIFENEDSEFYLTGGTCLSRFYYEKRYSIDLDLFTNYSNNFRYSILEILGKITKNNFNYTIKIESKDVTRIFVDDLLHVDFVNDRVKYIDSIKKVNKYNIDNTNNILANKITAILGRDNAKDVFDIYIISKNESFDWSEIINFAKEKMVFNLENLVSRLKSFPKVLISGIDLIDKKILINFDKEFDLLIEDIVVLNKNSLYTKNDK